MRKRGILLFVFLSFLVLSAVFYFLFQVTALKKVHGITEALFTPISRLVVSIYPKHEEEVAQLKEENRSLREQLTKKTFTDQDTRALRDQFQIQSISSRKLLPARIIGMRTFVPGITFPEEITIDKGAKDKVMKGASILVKETVIGQVTLVSERMAKVMLLSSPSSSVSVETLGSRALGILRGKGNGAMRLENVLLSDKLTEKDSIVTKGEQDVSGTGYPQGLLIGKIASVNKKASDLFQSAEVESALTIPEVTTVFVLMQE